MLVRQNITFLQTTGLLKPLQTNNLQIRSHHCEPSSPIFDYRRRKERSRWPSSDEIIEDYLSRNHGCDILLNWSLNHDSIFPQNFAFRNLHSRALIMFSEGKKDKSGALHTQVQQKPSQTLYFLPTQEQLESHYQKNINRMETLINAAKDYQMDYEGLTQEGLEEAEKELLENNEANRLKRQEGEELLSHYFRPQEEVSLNAEDLRLSNNGKSVSQEEGARISKELKVFLSSEEHNLYVHDGVIGSDPRTELRVRVVTNSANVAHLVKNILPKTSLPSDPRSFSPPVVIFHAKQEGGERVQYIDFCKGEVYLKNEESSEQIKEIMNQVSYHYLKSRQSLLLEGSYAFRNHSKNETYLVLSSDPSLVKKFTEQNKEIELYSEQSTIWSKFGLSTVFSDRKNPTLKRGDIIEHVFSNQKETSLNYICESSPHTIISHPKKLVVLSSSPSSSSTVDTLSQYFEKSISSHLPVQPQAWAQALAQRLEETKVPLELIKPDLASLKKSLLS